MDKLIRIECQGAAEASYTHLINLQGDLKVLTDEAYNRFKANILVNGFSEPISIWKDDDKLRIVNGHQRLATVKRMVENEDYQVGKLPINFVFAKTYQEAKKKVLALTSEYGQISNQGLVNFLMDVDIDADYLRDAIKINNVNVEDILKQIGDIKSNVTEQDELDVGSMVVGSEQPTQIVREQEAGSKTAATVKNDVMTGLRLMQIFLTPEQLEEVKMKVDRIVEAYGLQNTTEAILKALDVAFAATENMGVVDAANKPKSKKKSKA